MISPSLDTIKSFGGITKVVYTENDLNIPGWYPINLNIVKNGNEYLASFRAVNYIIDDTGVGRTTIDKNIHSKIFIANFNAETHQLTNVKEVLVEQLEKDIFVGLEDPKLIYRNSSWHIVCSVTQYSKLHLYKMVVCKLNNDLTKVESINFISSPNIYKPEKNWMFTNDVNKNFDCIYEFNTIVKDNRLIRDFHTNSFTSELDYKLRGNGTLLELDNNYIALMHSSYGKHYNHYFCIINRQGKFIGISKPFVFDSFNIEFAAGIVEHDNNYIISYGKDDSHCKIAIVPINNVIKSINKIQYDDLKGMSSVW